MLNLTEKAIEVQRLQTPAHGSGGQRPITRCLEGISFRQGIGS